MDPMTSPSASADCNDSFIQEAQGELFDLPPDIVYLNTAGAGPRLHAVNQVAQRALADSARPWQLTKASEWLEQTELLRSLAATLLETEADALAYTPSVSYGMAVAAHNLTLRAGQNVVVLGREYPSNRAVWTQRAEQIGATIREVEPEAGEGWTNAVLRHIDEHTAVLSLPHCHWTDGALLDLPRIAAAARAVSAALVIDASQSLGALPFDFAAVAPDFVMAPGHKWLLGAYGLGWLWVSPHWREHGEPIEQTILAREALGDFTTLGLHPPPYRRGARRFDFGPYPHPLTVPMNIAALEQLLRWGGAARISARLRSLTDTLRLKLRNHGLEDGLPPAPGAAHLCAWQAPSGLAPRLQQHLHRSGIILSVRGDGLRIAPHLHVDDTQLDHFTDALARGLRQL